MSRRHPQRSSARVQASSECARRGQCASPASQFQTEMERDRHSTVSLAESSAAWGLLTSVALQPSDGLALGAAGLSSKNLLRARAGSICVNGPPRGVEDLRRFGWGARGTCKWATDAKQQISSHTSCPLRQTNITVPINLPPQLKLGGSRDQTTSTRKDGAGAINAANSAPLGVRT